jgi:hypothetical protein
MKCQRMEFRQTGCIPPQQQHFQSPQSSFSKHNHGLVLLCKVRYIEHLLNIVGEDKRFVFVTKDPEINTNITIFVLAHSSLPIGDPSTKTRLPLIVHNQAPISPLFDHNMCLSPCHHQRHYCCQRRLVHAHHYFDRRFFYPRSWCRACIH